MSLDKAIIHTKEHRKQYVFTEGHGDTRAIDYSCRNHGSCAYCEGNRTFKHHKAKVIAELLVEEFLLDCFSEGEYYEI